jgi:hypothetical protein
MTKWTDWITHDGSAECPVPEGVRFQWCFGQFPAVRYDSGRNGPPYWADVTRYRTRLPGKKAQRIAELEAKLAEAKEWLKGLAEPVRVEGSVDVYRVTLNPRLEAFLETLK